MGDFYPPKSKEMLVRLSGCESVLLYVSGCLPCDGLATCPLYTLYLTLCQLVIPSNVVV